MIPIDTVLVPQGAEYRAVCRGLKQANCDLTKVVAIPIGTKNVEKALEDKQFWQIKPRTVLLTGLCGSLSARYSVGDKILYCSCDFGNESLATDKLLTDAIKQKLSKSVYLANSVTSDRPICQVKEKLRLSKIYPNSIVDMEGFAYLQELQQRNVAVAMLRVVSDDLRGDLPDLGGAIDNDGNLKPFALAIAMLKQPLAAARLIKGSLIGLNNLQQIMTELFSD